MYAECAELCLRENATVLGRRGQTGHFDHSWAAVAVASKKTAAPTVKQAAPAAASKKTPAAASKKEAATAAAASKKNAAPPAKRAAPAAASKKNAAPEATRRSSRLADAVDDEERKMMSSNKRSTLFVAAWGNDRMVEEKKQRVGFAVQQTAYNFVFRSTVLKEAYGRIVVSMGRTNGAGDTVTFIEILFLVDSRRRSVVLQTLEWSIPSQLFRVHFVPIDALSCH